mgnify:CR=1 FL=1
MMRSRHLGINMSEVKVNKISPRSGTGVQLGDSGDKFTVPSGSNITIDSGATIVNDGTATGFDTDTNDKVKVTTNDTTPGFLTTKILAGTNISLTTGNPSGDETLTIANTAPTPDPPIVWQSVVTAATLTTIAGRGYPINTTSNACTVTLPAAASVGDQVQIVDYAGTFASNIINLTSSLNINGSADDKALTTNREGVIITYVDVTQGWVATSGVNSGNQALDPAPYAIDFLVVAGGAGGGKFTGGGGGAGGYRTSTQTVDPSVAITATIGNGGAGSTSAGSRGSAGVDSSFSGSGLTTITSSGGGGGGSHTAETNGADGGSGGGGSDNTVPSRLGGSGDTPSTTPAQGFDGGTATDSGDTTDGAGGGGGASAVGADGVSTVSGGNGGAGSASSITGASVNYAGGGGGGTGAASSGSASGGAGGGGAGGKGTSGAGTAGTVNLGGGAGGGGGNGPGGNGGAGGSGVVILSMADGNYSGTTTGSPTVDLNAGGTGKTVLTFTGTGSYTS